MSREQKKKSVPLPHCLSSLQKAASAKFGMSVQEVLDTAQSLYEKKLTTYTIKATKAVTSDRLRQYAFRSIDDLPEERGWGWVNIDDIFDAEWLQSVPEKGGFMCFSLRTDTRKVSSAVLRKHLAEALIDEEAKAAAEGHKVSRSRKKELKEVCAAKLMKQAEPVPSSLDVAVDMESRLVLVGSVSTAQLELFEQHFAATFGQKPERWLLDPADGQNLLATI